MFDLFSNFQGNVKKNAPAVLPSDLSPNTLLTMIEEFNKTSHGLIMTLVCVCMYVCMWLSVMKILNFDMCCRHVLNIIDMC